MEIAKDVRHAGNEKPNPERDGRSLTIIQMHGPDVRPTRLPRSVKAFQKGFYAQMLIVVKQMTISQKFIDLSFSVFRVFLVVSQAPGPGRHVEDSQGKNSHLLSSQSDHRSPNFGRKTDLS